MKIKIVLTLTVVIAIAYMAFAWNNEAAGISNNQNLPQDQEGEVIYFAGGCFWGVEHFFKQIEGVTKTSVGYANGSTKNPTYSQVIKGNTGYAETVEVLYDPEILDLADLVDFYFKIIDPTSLNKQGNDRGTQYRTGIYFQHEDERPIIDAVVQKIEKLHKKPLVVEVAPLKSYFIAEEYHQEYLVKNPEGYCHIDSRWFEWAKTANKK